MSCVVLVDFLTSGSGVPSTGSNLERNSSYGIADSGGSAVGLGYMTLGSVSGGRCTVRVYRHEHARNAENVIRTMKPETEGEREQLVCIHGVGEDCSRHLGPVPGH